MPLHAGRRHPLCPSCRYDLVKTVSRDGRVCPECGCEFEPNELLRERCGFDGPVPGGAASAVLLVVVAAGAVLIGRTIMLGVIAIGIAARAAGTTGLVVIVPSAILDE